MNTLISISSKNSIMHATAKSFFIFTLLLSILSACNKNKCEKGFESTGDICACPQGKLVLNGTCRELKPNEYYAVLGDCTCKKDTVVFEVLDKTDNHISIKIDLGWGTEITGCGLIKQSDGDSLSEGDGGTFTKEWACTINGVETTTKLSGKFIDNDTKIRMHLKYVDILATYNELGHCDFVAHQ
jgi:hypothetical protein